jgi:hypothetical protein
MGNSGSKQSQIINFKINHLEEVIGVLQRRLGAVYAIDFTLCTSLFFFSGRGLVSSNPPQG